MAQRLLFTSVAMAAALLQTEFESWSKGYRAVWLSFGALFGQALLGPSLPAMLLPLVGVDVQLSSPLSFALLRVGQGVAALFVAWGLGRLVPMADSRRASVLLGTAALLAALSWLHASAEGLSMIAARSGSWFVLPAALRLPLRAETTLQGLQYIAVLIALADVGFVTRRWAVLGIPALTMFTAAHGIWALLGCAATTGWSSLLCKYIAPAIAPWSTTLGVVCVVCTLLAYLVLLVLLAEIGGSVRRVVLDAGRPTPREGDFEACTDFLVARWVR